MHFFKSRLNDFIFALLFSLISCNHSDDTPVSLEENLGAIWLQDGVLTDEDLQPGQTAILFTYTPIDTKASSIDFAYISDNSEIIYDERALMCPQGWAIWVRVPETLTGNKFSVFVWFHDTNSEKEEMSAGSGQVFAMSVDIPSIEHGKVTYGPFSGGVSITESTGSITSGWINEEVLIETGFYQENQIPSGEKFYIKGIAFNDIPTVLVSEQEDCEP